jgi:caa(3)-type oxidase subunit IV
MADSPEQIKKAVKSYIVIGLVLFIFTGVTVAVATIPALDIGVHGFDVMDMILGLAIATFKATLVGYVFMHLNHEKKAIYWIFFGAFVFFAFMIILFMAAKSDPIHYNGFNFGLPY